MNRLTDNDKNWGPFTWAKWKNRISLEISSGDDEDPECTILAVAFGRALRIHIPTILWPTGKYGEHPTAYGFSLSKQGECYDFLSLRFGPQTHDSITTKDWNCFLPWTQWDFVRHTLFTPELEHFATDEKGKRSAFSKLKAECPAVHFGFEDYDGEMIVATCKVEEREWHRGEGCFKWLKYFWPAKIHRSLDLRFSAQVGPEKGSWKGGTTGHGIDMLPGEYPINAFKRYCSKKHDQRGREFSLRFIGPCSAPNPVAV